MVDDGDLGGGYEARAAYCSVLKWCMVIGIRKIFHLFTAIFL